MNETPQGRVITFYSYKGGTGRSMALANAACWLTRRGGGREGRVLMMDWDLEAPGLHRYFEARGGPAEAFDRPGVIDYFVALRDRLDGEPGLYKRLTGEGGVGEMRSEFPLDGCLIRDVVTGVDLVRAGKLDSKYAEQVSTFDWVSFYKKYGAVFESFREMLTSAYDYTLIDSRTGFNDVSGVCTMLLPETLVTVFTPNRQSLSGVIDLATRAADYRRASNDFRPLSVFPLPSRIENAELALKREWRQQYQQEFEAALRAIYKLEACDLTAYFDEVQLPQVAYYAYGEKVALLEERSDALSLGRAYEVFFGRLTGLDFAWESPAEAEEADGPDIYISYAQEDDRPLDGEGQGWVEMLHERLVIRLQELLGRRVRIFRDRKSTEDSFFEAVFPTLSRAKILLAVVSPAYLNSSRSEIELDEFWRGGSARDGRQLFKVVKSPVPDEEPRQLHSLVGYNFIGYPFYGLDESGRTAEFQTDLPNKDRRYWGVLEDLAWNISKVLREIDARGGARAEYVREEGSLSGKVVYLAEATSDVSNQRDGVKRDLLTRGVVVLPDRPLPFSQEQELRAETSAYLKRCSLSVHMVGWHYGVVPEGEDRSVVELQVQLAAEERSINPGLDALVWMPKGVIQNDERHTSFVKRLKQGEYGLEVLETNVEELKTVLVQRLSEPMRAAPKSAAPAPRSALISAHRTDSSFVFDLLPTLQERAIELVISPEGDSPASNNQHFKEQMGRASFFIIVFGGVAEDWVRERLYTALKIVVSQETPLLFIAVYTPAALGDRTLNFLTRGPMRVARFSTPEELGVLLNAHLGNDG